MDRVRTDRRGHRQVPDARPGPRGCIITIIVGIVGAVLGGMIATWLGYGGISGFDFRSFVIAVLGAILLLFLWRMISGRGRRR